MIKQGLPCALNKLHIFVFGTDFVVDESSFKNISIFDARKTNPGDFHKTGFTLIEIDEPITKDWRKQYIKYNSTIRKTLPDETADIVHFHK